MGRGQVPITDVISAIEFHKFFDAKVEGVRTMTADAPPPSFLPVPPGSSLHEFQLLAANDVVAAVRKLPDKQSANDPLSTRLLKDNADILAPFLVELVNRCLHSGSVPTLFKAAYITPRLFKEDRP